VIDFLLQMGLSNTCFALILAILAMCVGAKVKRPHLAYMLWLLVFVRLITPPIVTLPVDISLVQPGLIAIPDALPIGTESTAVFEMEIGAQSAIAATMQGPSTRFNIGAMLSAAKPHGQHIESSVSPACCKRAPSQHFPN